MLSNGELRKKMFVILVRKKTFIKVLFCLFLLGVQIVTFSSLFKREKKAHTSRIVIDDVFELRL